MNAITTSALSLILLFLGITAVTFMAIMFGRGKQPNNHTFFKLAHRISGYLFLALYLFICTIMFQRLSRGFVLLSSKDVIHAYIGTSIFPFIVAKICIVHIFNRYRQSLVVYGMIIMVAVFVTVTMSAGYYLISLAGNKYITLSHRGKLVKVNLSIGRKVVHEKCVGCHSLERVYSHNKTEADWRYYVSLMRAKDPENMNELEEIQAIGYLVKNLGLEESKMDIKIGLKIILSKCDTCHSIERIFKSRKTGDEWRETVAKMQSLDPSLLNSAEVNQVNYFLSTVLGQESKD